MDGVLVTVAETQGSTPREQGTWMFVTREGAKGTIGGGHLELRAIDIARTMLARGTARHAERFALGPSLGQCCGGVVHLHFSLAEAPPPPPAPLGHLLLFGAGHVGTALVKALADLPCTVTWIDERDDLLDVALPANVSAEATDTPEALVASAPAQASYLVMTHSHTLDLRLAAAILGRDEVRWFGMIGSHTKRRQFEHRLRERGLDAAPMVCPIGLPGIGGKAPAVIAASVAAQLLMAWDAGPSQGK
ncbi:MAG: xanthine dehydrogenase accessory protein XdhC [Gammaproteobacteria bacterium]